MGVFSLYLCIYIFMLLFRSIQHQKEHRVCGPGHVPGSLTTATVPDTEDRVTYRKITSIYLRNRLVNMHL